MTKQLHWNTGRGYTAKGQRITATLHDEVLAATAEWVDRIEVLLGNWRDK